MAAFVEIERKFLIPQLPDFIVTCPSRRISQGYILCRDASVEIRLRKDGDRYIQSIKKGSGIERFEINLPLSQSQFMALWPLTEGSRIEKIRYVFGKAPGIIEVDVYQGPAEGLITADVEFTSLEEAEKYVPPNWFGADITLKPEFRNRSLAS